MAVYKRDLANIELESGTIFRSFMGNTIGSGDNNANRFGVRVFRNGQPVDLTGCSCQGIFINAEGTPIALTSYGTVSGNVAYITLPPACYNVEGNFTLAIKLVGDGITGTMRIVDGIVSNTGTNGAVAPTGSVPTYQEIIAQFDEMQAATEAAELVNEKAFRTIAAFTDGTKNLVDPGELITADLQNGVVVDGTHYVTGYIPVEEGETYVFSGNCMKGTYENAFYDEAKDFISRDFGKVITVPSGAMFMRVEFQETVGIDEVRVMIEKGDKPGVYTPYLQTDEVETVESLVSGGSGNRHLAWQAGLTYNSETGEAASDTDYKRVSTPEGTWNEFRSGCTLTIASGARAVVYRYDMESHAFIGQSGWKTGSVYLPAKYAYKFVLGAVGDSLGETLTEGYSENYAFTVPTIMDYITEIRAGQNEMKSAEGIVALEWQADLAYVSATGEPAENRNTARISTPADVYYESEIGFEASVDAGYRYYVYKYAKTAHTFVGTEGWITGRKHLNPDYAYKIVFAKTDNTEMDVLDTYHFQLAETAEDTEGGALKKYAGQIRATVTEAMADRDPDTLSVVFVTDSHYSGSYDTREHMDIAAEMATLMGADFLIHGGDVINGYAESRLANKEYFAPMMENMKKTTRPVMYALGHHELYGVGRAAQYMNDPTAMTVADVIGMWGKDTRWIGDVHYSSDKSSYYFDVNGVRVIVINSCATTSTVGFTSTETELVTEALTNCTLPVVFFAHTPTRASVNWNGQNVTNGGDMETIIKGYDNVLAYVHGHTHWDNIVKCSDLDFPFISTCCSLPVRINTEEEGCEEGTPTSYDRAIGTITEYCIDIINFHPDTGKVNLFRFGCGTDRSYTPQ